MDTQTEVTRVIAQLTRYPTEILTPEADFEADLGIDSVKRTEILAHLQKQYGLPDDLQVTPAEVSSILGVTRFIDAARAGEVPVRAPTPPVPAPAPVPVPAPDSDSDWADALTWAEAAPATPPPAAPSPTPAVAPTARRSGDPRRQALEALREVLDRSLQELDEAPRPAATRDLAGQVLWVTGSGRGLGRTLALGLASRGARIVVNSFHSRDQGDQTAAEIVDAGGEAHHVWGSVANEEHRVRMVAELQERFGVLHGLVHNASNGYLGPLEHLTDDYWHRSFDTNVVGLHRCTMLAAPLMERAGGGRVVALSSPGADRVIEHFGCQGPVKAALESLVRYLAVELGPRGIQVNALSAGPLYGELIHKYPDADRLIPYWESRNAAGRLGDGEALVAHVAFLLTAPAISGSTLLVDDTGSTRI
jgi:NAD(P)-dependent dehydrogenase (short-subunit alcohol dehydrogenase family)/acyl carrier protein